MLVHGLQPDCHVPSAFGGVGEPCGEVRLRFAKDKAWSWWHTHTYKDTYIHTCIQAYIHTSIHTYVRTYIHTYIPT